MHKNVRCAAAGTFTGKENHLFSAKVSTDLTISSTDSAPDKRGHQQHGLLI